MAQAAFNGLQVIWGGIILLYENISAVRQSAWLSGWLRHADY